MRRFAVAAAMLLAACRPVVQPTYLYVWAGDSAGTASDFIGVIDATPSSANYGSIVASIPTGDRGTHPHHTEATMPANRHLLANGFHAGKTWLFDLTTPMQPRILTSFGSLGGFSHPHTFVRLANGNVLTTFQYQADSTPATHAHAGSAMDGPTHRAGGLVEMTERGDAIRSASARDTAISDARLYPYSALPLPGIDRIVSTTTNMDEADTISTARWIQLWRLSDLTLLQSIALEPGQRGNENRWTGEPFALPDGRVLIHTFMCGLYLLREVDGATPHASLVHTFEGINCGVPVHTGHFYLATVPEAHAIVALDVSDPEHPRQVSSLSLGADEAPHWLSIDATGRRLVANSSDDKGGNRLFLINLDPATGALTMDDRFRDAGDSLPGIRLTGKNWPHGFSGRTVPHGTVFSR